MTQVTNSNTSIYSFFFIRRNLVGHYCLNLVRHLDTLSKCLNFYKVKFMFFNFNMTISYNFLAHFSCDNTFLCYIMFCFFQSDQHYLINFYSCTHSQLYSYKKINCIIFSFKIMNGNIIKT